MNANTVRTAERDGNSVKALTRYKLLNAFNELAAEKYQTTYELMFPRQ